MPDFDVTLRGYDQYEVDDLFGRIEETLDDGSRAESPVTAERVRGTTFTTVMRGYDPDAVDSVLQGYIRELERRERHSSGQWRIMRTST